MSTTYIHSDVDLIESDEIVKEEEVKSDLNCCYGVWCYVFRIKIKECIYIFSVNRCLLSVCLGVAILIFLFKTKYFF